MNTKQKESWMPEGWHFDKRIACSSVAGDYLLKNGSRSKETVYDNEVGVYINENVHILLHFPKEKLTAQEAQSYAHLKGGRIPTLGELWQIQMNHSAISNSFGRIMYPVWKLPQNVLEDCWCTEDVAQKANDGNTLKVLILVQGENNEHFDVSYHAPYAIIDRQAIFKWRKGMFRPLPLRCVSFENGAWMIEYHMGQCTDAFSLKKESGIEYVGRYVQDLY